MLNNITILAFFFRYIVFAVHLKIYNKSYVSKNVKMTCKLELMDSSEFAE
jgi:hypothetical protein